MQISIGSKQYQFSGHATPNNIAQQIAAQESGTSADALSKTISQAVFGASYRRNDIIDPKRFEDGILNLDSKPFAKLLGQVASSPTASGPVLMPPPPVVVQKVNTTTVPVPKIPTDILQGLSLAVPERAESKSRGVITKQEVETHPVFKACIAPLLKSLPFTNFELTNPRRDSQLETGAYFNPKTNRVILNQDLPIGTILDNLIFELCNAQFMTQFESISRAFDEGSLNVVDYGKAYATTEFKTQMAYTAIVQNMQSQGFSLPPGAQKALQWVNRVDPNYSQTQNTSQLVKSFMTLPHNPEADVRDVSSLPTPEMYSFQALEKLGGQKLFNLIESAVGKELLPPQFSGWARHNFPMKSVSYKRAKAYEEVINQAARLVQGQPKALQALSELQLTPSLVQYAARRAGPRVMPPYQGPNR